MISIYEPEWRPEDQPQKRRGRPPTAMSANELDKLIGGTNKRQMTLEILRTARRPLSTAECAQEFAAEDREGFLFVNLDEVLDRHVPAFRGHEKVLAVLVFHTSAPQRRNRRRRNPKAPDAREPSESGGAWEN
ncbi:hypothetical protein RFM41_30215 [Mesorhizobium sp. VK25A]|uniref:Uncharacterized protein n=2 Tax=Mesorhizobium TaxID=68287 RepID=A0ABU5AC40_9HYPH|nr:MULTISPECIES: hypothetical protein [unclassified Mesorhizobium]MDX8502259.1 hypothetical protein [Mesorhizobium sp. VK4C]MDX8535283.1 hypothetical protein [Mesorhizobium sp. VK25D]MDX8548046.1 hypothetical protein [Mesorhizobium sp. VK25A]